LDGHPIRLRLDDDLRRSRVTVFFRLLLTIPHFWWFGIWSIGAPFAAIAGWFAALVTGRMPLALHNFLAGYLRYGTHVAAYVLLIANPFPGFLGHPGYPVDVEIAEPVRQSRWKTVLRLILGIPALLLAFTLAGGGPIGVVGGVLLGGGVVVTCAFLAWFAALVLGRMPLGLRDLSGYSLGYGAQANAYFLLLTDRYPNSDPDAIGPEWNLTSHQLQLELSDDGRRSRLTVFFRLLLALPHFVWLALWTVLAFLAAIVNGIVALVRGRSAEPLHRFLAAYVRYSAHVTAFITLVANPFPGFVGAPGFPVDISIGPPVHQNRWVTLFRTFLVIPALIVSSAVSGILATVSILGWFVSLLTGRMPTGFINVGAMSVRYLAQTNAYWFVVTDDYPHASPALRPPPPPEPEWKPEPEWFWAAI
jgi:hypothetical protein